MNQGKISITSVCIFLKLNSDNYFPYVFIPFMLVKLSIFHIAVVKSFMLNYVSILPFF